MSVPTAEPPEVVNEQDKPFFLVVGGSIAVVGIATYAIVTGKWDTAKDFVGQFMILVSSGWAFYFKSKS